MERFQPLGREQALLASAIAGQIANALGLDVIYVTKIAALVQPPWEPIMQVPLPAHLDNARGRFEHGHVRHVLCFSCRSTVACTQEWLRT